MCVSRILSAAVRLATAGLVVLLAAPAIADAKPRITKAPKR
jgi:hypothetical protein